MFVAIRNWRRKRPQHLLLPRRMAGLEVDADKVRRIEPTVFDDLQSLCAACEASQRCEADLMHNPGNPGWQDYCPNAAMLSALGAVGLFGPPARPWPAERPPRRPPF